MTVFASSGQARTFNYQGGDVGQFVVPLQWLSTLIILLGYVPASFGELISCSLVDA